MLHPPTHRDVFSCSMLVCLCMCACYFGSTGSGFVMQLSDMRLEAVAAGFSLSESIKLTSGLASLPLTTLSFPSISPATTALPTSAVKAIARLPVLNIESTKVGMMV